MSRRYAEEVHASLYPDRDPAGASQTLSRRGFLRMTGLAGGGLLIAMGMPGCKDKPRGDGDFKPEPTPETPPAPGEPFAANTWVTIAPDGSATITVAKSEMGQGVRTTLAMLVAEELDLDWSKVRVTQAPEHPDKYGRQGTGGSSSVRDGWKPLREAGAAARAMLVAAAASKLGVPAGELTTADSQVVHAASGKKVGYGELTNLAAQQTAPTEVTLKQPRDYRILGKEHPGIDVKDIIQGKARYGMDVRQPGMLFASIERTPVFGGKIKKYDAAAAMAVPGVVKVVEVQAVGPDVNVHSGVAVIAKNTWAAMQGRAKLAIEWDAGPHARESSEGYLAEMERSVGARGKVEVNKLGDPDTVLSKARTALRARYDAPFIAHATMEPMNCTARVEGNRCQIWGPTQFPNWAADAIAKVLEIPRENVAVEISLLGGGFGRRINPDYAVEAALVARQVEGPVQVSWTRTDDLQHDFYRPMALHVIEASLGADGYPEAWRHRMATTGIQPTVKPEATEDEIGVQESNGASDMLYRVPNRSLEYTYQAAAPTRGWWRGVHTTHTTFAVESFIDELAEKAGKDPYEYRMHLIDALQVARPTGNPEFPWDPARLRGVLELAAKKAEWGKALPPGHGMGIACGIDHLSYAAEVIEVSVIDGKLRIHRVVCAADCGPVMNPNGARAQLEGGVIQALSAALREKITVAGGRVQQGNFDSYQILRIHEAPVTIETHFANTDTHPTGLGEPSVPPVAAALANAIYRATGKRLRSLPLQI
jgi:isoquinoline 1-oxidoreductase beta subunit